MIAERPIQQRHCLMRLGQFLMVKQCPSCSQDRLDVCKIWMTSHKMNADTFFIFFKKNTRHISWWRGPVMTVSGSLKSIPFIAVPALPRLQLLQTTLDAVPRGLCVSFLGCFLRHLHRYLYPCVLLESAPQ